MSTIQPVLLAAKDPALVEAIEASCLALDVRLEPVTDSELLARRWPGAALRLVAPEMAARASRLASLPGTHLVGRDATALADASAELGCPVLCLPEASDRLADLLAAAVREDPTRGRTVAVLGAAGGVGASTLALGLALHAARAGASVAAVELAGCGGGLDLLAGREAAEGLRWSGLASARGELGQLEDELVGLEGMALLAHDRAAPVVPEPAAVEAVLGALTRTREHIVVDAGREPVAQADLQLLVVPADVRGVASARMLAAATGLVPDAIVMRRGLGRELSAGTLARALGVEPVGVLREDRALPRAAVLGQPPLVPAARRFRRDVAAIWKGLP